MWLGEARLVPGAISFMTFLRERDGMFRSKARQAGYPGQRMCGASGAGAYDQCATV